jgi:hypothetical protein
VLARTSYHTGSSSTSCSASSALKACVWRAQVRRCGRLRRQVQGAAAAGAGGCAHAGISRATARLRAGLQHSTRQAFAKSSRANSGCLAASVAGAACTQSSTAPKCRGRLCGARCQDPATPLHPSQILLQRTLHVHRSRCSWRFGRGAARAALSGERRTGLRPAAQRHRGGGTPPQRMARRRCCRRAQRRRCCTCASGPRRSPG